jgi:diguanylate cyclase (GGDEF)-like protein
MKPRSILIYGATAIAAATLALAGRDLAHRFLAKDRLLDLAGPILAVATALICIGVLDWARNLHTHSRRDRPEDSGEEAASADARAASSDGSAEPEVIQAVHALERLAGDEAGPERTVQEAIKVVAGFAHAASIDLWRVDETGNAKPRAKYADGVVTLSDEGSLSPAEQDAARQAMECRRPLEGTEGGNASFLLPLLGGQRCFGVLRVVAPVPEADGAVQKLGAQLPLLARHVARAVRAPELYDQALLDPLTGLYTKRHFINRLTEATGVSRRYGEPLSLVLMDVDSFQTLNASYGTATGDRVLQHVAALVQQNVREVDSAFRYGADEVAIILPNTEADKARLFAERMRRIVRESRALAEDGGGIITTVSLGVAEFDEDMRGIGPLLARVEEALYAAKTSGRDRVEVARPPSDVPSDGDVAD